MGWHPIQRGVETLLAKCFMPLNKFRLYAWNNTDLIIEQPYRILGYPCNGLVSQQVGGWGVCVWGGGGGESSSQTPRRLCLKRFILFVFASFVISLILNC